MATLHKLMSSDEAIAGLPQHKQPCPDCPWARDSLPGWLGGESVEYWRSLGHSDHVVDCHTIKDRQCAGISIYRHNVCKRVEPPNLKLPGDTTKVFASPMEFEAHHTRRNQNDFS